MSGVQAERWAGRPTRLKACAQREIRRCFISIADHQSRRNLENFRFACKSLTSNITYCTCCQRAHHNTIGSVIYKKKLNSNKIMSINTLNIITLFYYCIFIIIIINIISSFYVFSLWWFNHFSLMVV